jgi:hypothetical protein
MTIVATGSRAAFQSGQPYETGRPYGLTRLSIRAPLREQVHPGPSERLVSAGRMQHDPAVRESQGHAVARLNFCRCLFGKLGAVRSQQVRVGVRRPSTRTACGLQYRSSRQRLLRGQFGKGARRRQAWLSKVRSTLSPQPFCKPKSPNCNEGENENPSARKKS